MRLSGFIAAVAATASMARVAASAPTQDPVRPRVAMVPFSEQRGLPGPPKHRSQRQQRKARRRG